MLSSKKINLYRDFAVVVYLPEAQNPIPTIHCICVPYTVYLFTQEGGGGGGGER
jgi:hypothetical protein